MSQEEKHTTTIQNQFIFEAGSVNTIIKDSTFNGPVYTCKPEDNNNATEGEPAEDDTPNPRGGEGIEEELLPIFFCDRKVVGKFLSQIRGAKPIEVVRQVNILIKEGKVSTKSCHKELWSVLSRHGLYERTYQNWHDQIKI